MPQFTTASILNAFEWMRRSTQPDDFFLCISESTKNDWCEETGTDEAHCFVTPLAAADYFRPCDDAAEIAEVRKCYGIPEDCHYFLGVSTVEPRKNIATVINAFFAFLRETGRTDFRLVLAGGEGWKVESTFLAADSDSSLRANVIFTGYVDEKKLAPLYSGARAFVYLSFYEGCGLPPLEAMQCGVPVICSNTSSLPEVVGDAAILLDPTDTEGLSAAFVEIADNDELYSAMSKRSQERAKLFSWSRCVEATVAAYQQAM
jgi:glycosyltransferase involved in cell wall biosynthesis